MPIPVGFAAGPAGYALVDLKEALDAAHDARDGRGGDWLQRLMFVYVKERLASKSPTELEVYLRSRRVWRRDGVHAVFKSVDEPCVAYAALEFDDGVQILVLGFCHRYPRSEEAWWLEHIRPRLRQYV